MLTRINKYIINDKILNGRDQGKALREKILAHLEKEPVDIIMPISFEHVDFMDYSLTDEMLCKLIRRIISGELGERYIVVESLNESLKENINVALKERELCCVYVKSDGKVEILGKLSTPLRETYEYAVEQKKITTRDIFDVKKFNLENISAASNRLTRLEKLGLLHNNKDEVVEGGGRQFVFEAIK